MRTSLRSSAIERRSGATATPRVGTQLAAATSVVKLSASGPCAASNAATGKNASVAPEAKAVRSLCLMRFAP